MNTATISTGIPGCDQLVLPAHTDDRGAFIKTFSLSSFRTKGWETDFVETFFTTSGQNVLRGMHLQAPPADQAKLVYCLSGSVMDVVLDLRRGSPRFGQFAVIELSADRHNAVYLPRGVAHGFYVRTAPAIMMYHVTAEYVPALDTGIAWDSFGAPWPTSSPIVSSRDRNLPTLAEFDSPFEFSPASQDKVLTF